MDVDLHHACEQKLVLNDRKYPADKCQAEVRSSIASTSTITIQRPFSPAHTSFLRFKNTHTSRESLASTRTTRPWNLRSPHAPHHDRC
jgi:hypothetical protein